MTTTYTDNGTNTPNGTHLDFTYTFPVLQTEDVKVALNGVTQTTTKYSVSTSPTSKITFNNTSVDSTVQESTGAPKTGVLVRVYRHTVVHKNNGDSDPKAVFSVGSSIRAGDLNNNVDQALFGIAELQERKALTENIQDGAVTTAKIMDGTIVDADISGSAAIAQSKIATGNLPSGITVNSDNIVDGSIVIGDLQAGTLDSRYYTETELDGGQLDNRYFTESELTGGAVDGRYYTENELDAGQLDNRYYTETELDGGQLDNRYYTETQLDGGSLDARYYTETELNAGQLDNQYYTETELDGGQLDNRYYTETEADGRFLRQDSTDVIDTSASWTVGNTHVATTGAIEARVIDLIDDVGGFDAIANETSFPATNPQGTAGQSAILSIAAVSTTLTPTANVITIANGAGTGNTVTINNVTASSIPQGFGLLVESTSTLHTYNFHRLVPKALDVNTVATNIGNVVACGNNLTDIENFADLYQISTSAPTTRADGTALTTGDLWFDSSANQVMMVYDGSTGDGFSPITPDQSTITAINSVSGHVTFTEDLGLITNAVNTGSGNNSINTCGANIASINTVAADLNETTSEIDTVATNIANVNNVGNSITNVDAVAGNATNINAAVANATNINAAVSNASNINSAVSNASNINTVAGISSNVTTVATNTSNINAAVANQSNINSVVSNATNINTVATNVADVNNFVDRYQISSSAPTQRDDGTALQNGDLWFNNSSQAMESYDGSAGDGYTPIQPSATVIQNIANVTGFVTFVEDNGLITDAINTGTGNNSINAVGADITNVNTVAGSIANVNTTAGDISNVNTVASNIAYVSTVSNAIADVNRYADEYVIQSSTPSSPSEGDLWYNSTANTLNYYNSSAWVAIAPGISGVVNDANPQLANHLDCNDKNLTEVATISGDNLQLDFGTVLD